MLVKELIEKLQAEDPEAGVWIEEASGPYMPDGLDNSWPERIYIR